MNFIADHRDCIDFLNLAIFNLPVRVSNRTIWRRMISTPATCLFIETSNTPWAGTDPPFVVFLKAF